MRQKSKLNLDQVLQNGRGSLATLSLVSFNKEFDDIPGHTIYHDNWRKGDQRK